MRRLAIVVVLLAGCGSTERLVGTDRRAPQGTQILAALAPLPGGGLRAGDLRTGAITDILGPGGRRPAAPRPIARVEVSSGGQRGLLGLAVDHAGRTFAAYSRRDGRLVVEQVAPGEHRLIWLGPPSTDLADGGHLVAHAGRLLIGIGDLQNRAATRDRRTPNGKLMSLDPDGPPGQHPRVLSSGWNNPYAFAVGAHDEVLVADNAPGREPERIADGRTAGGPPEAVTSLTERIAPSGLAVTGPDEVVVCGVRSGRLDDFVRRGGAWRRRAPLGPCRYGVVRLAGGRLAVSTGDGVRVISP